MDEIIAFMTEYFTKENIELAIAILAICGIGIDVNPKIKINPVRCLLRKFGRLINGELNDKVDLLGKQLDTTNKRIDVVNERLEKQDANDKKYRITSLHDRIFSMHRYFMKNKSITVADLENFHLCVEEYAMNGGNGTVKKKIVPEVDALPIDYSGEIEDFDETKVPKL